MKKLGILIIATALLPACAGQKVQHNDFDPSAPVEVRRPTYQYGHGLSQGGDVFKVEQMFDHLKDNKTAADKVFKGKTFYYSGLFLVAASAGTLVTADKASDIWTAITLFGLGYGATYYGKKKFLEAGRVHNEKFSSVGLGLLPVAQSDEIAPALLFSTGL